MSKQINALTPARHRALNAIAELTIKAGYPPTLREIGARCGIKSTNAVASILRPLRRDGYLAGETGKSRALRLTDKARRELGLGSLDCDGRLVLEAASGLRLKRIWWQ
jgi:repressor LexA